MSLHASAWETPERPKPLARLARPLDIALSRKAVELLALFCAAMLFAYVFMVPAFAAYVLAMYAGRWREWWWGLGACIAPATGITLISGQTGFLSGALMVGGLRLLPTRPALAGVLFGLLTYKPQLGVLVPVALVAMSGGRAIVAALATFAALAVASGL